MLERAAHVAEVRGRAEQVAVGSEHVVGVRLQRRATTTSTPSIASSPAPATTASVIARTVGVGEWWTTSSACHPVTVVRVAVRGICLGTRCWRATVGTSAESAHAHSQVRPRPPGRRRRAGASRPTAAAVRPARRRWRPRAGVASGGRRARRPADRRRASTACPATSPRRGPGRGTARLVPGGLSGRAPTPASDALRPAGRCGRIARASTKANARRPACSSPRHAQGRGRVELGPGRRAPDQPREVFSMTKSVTERAASAQPQADGDLDIDDRRPRSASRSERGAKSRGRHRSAASSATTSGRLLGPGDRLRPAAPGHRPDAVRHRPEAAAPARGRVCRPTTTPRSRRSTGSVSRATGRADPRLRRRAALRPPRHGAHADDRRPGRPDAGRLLRRCRPRAEDMAPLRVPLPPPPPPGATAQVVPQLVR